MSDAIARSSVGPLNTITIEKGTDTLNVHRMPEVKVLGISRIPSSEIES
jgi:hypothetical protein